MKYLFFFCCFFSRVVVADSSEDLGVLFICSSECGSQAEAASYFADTIFEDNSGLFGVEMLGVISGSASVTSGVVDSKDILREMAQEEGEFGLLSMKVKQYGADVVVYVHPSNDLVSDGRGVCGAVTKVSRTSDELAAVSPKYSYIVIKKSCLDGSTLAHEIGHTMGLAHGQAVRTATGHSVHTGTSYFGATGYGRIVGLSSANYDANDEVFEAGEFGTIMVDNYVNFWAGSAATTKGALAPFFSDSSKYSSFCENASGTNRRCGSNSANAAGHILNYRSYFLGRQTPDVYYLSFDDEAMTSCVRKQYPYGGLVNYFEVDEVFDIECVNNSLRSMVGLEKVTGLVLNGGSVRIDSKYSPLRGVKSILALHSSVLVDLSGSNNMNCSDLKSIDDRFVNFVSPKSCGVSAKLVSIGFM